MKPRPIKLHGIAALIVKALKVKRGQPGYMHHRTKNLTGQQFGDEGKKFTVLEISDKRKGNKYPRLMWLCQCHCGKPFETAGYLIQSGATKGCGCSRGGHNKRPKGQNGFYLAYKNHYYRAEKLNSAPLSEDEYKTLNKLPCHYCGALPSNCRQRGRWGEYFYSGADRVDNTKGYLKNSVPCCAQCNGAKSKQTVEEFIAHCRRVAAHQDSLTPPTPSPPRSE